MASCYHGAFILSDQHDDQLVKEYGIRLAVDMIQKIVNAGDVCGVHFCTLNLEKSVQLILEQLQWTRESPTTRNKLITVSLTGLT